MLGIVALAGLALTAPQAHAGFIATIQQVGSDVVITGSGTINTTALTFELEGPLGPEVFPSDTGVFLGTPYGSVGYYAGTLAGPSSFGGGGSTIGSSSSGSDVGTWGTHNTDPIAVPLGYVSGSPLSASDTFSNTTIAGLGITPGTYIWTWGSGPTADFFEITTTPEPTSVVLVGSAMLGLLALRRRIARRRGAALLGCEPGFCRRPEGRRAGRKPCPTCKLNSRDL